MKRLRLKKKWKRVIIIGLLLMMNKSNIIATTETHTYTQKEYMGVRNIEVKQEVNYACSSGKNKSYMNYKMITNKSSKQYQYIQANMKENDKGFLVDKGGRIGIALGSYFGEIGTKYDIELANGNILKVVKIEAKDDAHTNNGCEQRWDKSVIEFVIDVDKAKAHYGVANNGYINQGNYNNVDEFKGTIIKITKSFD